MARAWLSVVVMLSLAACADKPRRAPIVERQIGRPAGPPSPDTVFRPAGDYQVRSGDTLFKIAFEHDLDYRELARINGLDDTCLIHPGQRLQVPGKAAGVRTVPLASAPERIDARPLPRPGAGAAVVVTPPGIVPASTVERWVWPARGRIIVDFDPAKGRKGLDIAGMRDAPVKAVAKGTVVYAGSALRGYGKLTIIQHGPSLLSAYGHQSTLRVAEGQNVLAGEVIGGMGGTDTDQVKLHFEVREFGKPLDPRFFLPRQFRSEYGPG